ncbi:aminoglycoside phosphotransferase [Streptomyces sp. NPDC007088]|uniref:aminoglycoside phosphotransferase n=1 Tax=Streptomyces sp. NPDC007088 TaxID=3364773 RepID=UPI0036A8B122
MDERLATSLLGDLCEHLGREADPHRTEMRRWAHGGLERITFSDGNTLIHKYGQRPFTKEADMLRSLYAGGVPVPRVAASRVQGRQMSMLMEDLGEPLRPATEDEALAAVLSLHAAPIDPAVPRLTESSLRTLPERTLHHLDRLHVMNRWHGSVSIGMDLGRVRRVAEHRAQGADLPPYGWVHTELGYDGLHVGPRGLRLLDFARSYTGPGLFDLVSWGDGINSLSPRRTREFLERYVDAGGPPQTLKRRAGLPAERWALGWLRLWRLEWILEDACRDSYDQADDAHSEALARAELDQALDLFEL